MAQKRCSAVYVYNRFRFSTVLLYTLVWMNKTEFNKVSRKKETEVKHTCYKYTLSTRNKQTKWRKNTGKRKINTFFFVGCLAVKNLLAWKYSHSTVPCTPELLIVHCTQTVFGDNTHKHFSLSHSLVGSSLYFYFSLHLEFALIAACDIRLNFYETK